jgi:DNA-binding MarR family transcriptional regulator
MGWPRAVGPTMAAHMKIRNRALRTGKPLKRSPEPMPVASWEEQPGSGGKGLEAGLQPVGTDLLATGSEAGNRRLPILLRRAWYGLNQTFRRRIAHTGLTPDQYTVMRNLAEGDRRGLTQSQLTALMSSDPNTMAALVDRMETAGLIERRPHERDRRAQRLRLRARGRRRYGELLSIALKLQEDALAALPPERRSVFLEELARVADACRGAAEEERRRAEDILAIRRTE